jgi:uncharacterized membrane protein YphA (DoxX/SURF4 family)
MANYSRIILRLAVTVTFIWYGIILLLRPGFIGNGYSHAFAYFLGIAEIAGAAALWIQKFSRLAAAGLIVIMIGAIYTFLHNGEPRQGVVPVVVLFALTRLVMK